MITARVRGTVVAAASEDRIHGGRYLLVTPLSPTEATQSALSDRIRARGVTDTLVALDLVQADRGQIVLVSQGSSSRQSEQTDGRAVDAVIVGIVDAIDGGKVAHA